MIDELGREIELAAPPQRIVSLVPSLTEWLFAIGLSDRVVGVTEYCIRPAEGVADKLKLRGTKNPDRAAIIGLKPDLVIANKEENRQRDVDALVAAGLTVYVTDPSTVADAITTLETLARVLDAVAAAAPLISEMRATYDEVRATTHESPPRVLALIWRDPWMAIGTPTCADDLLRVCGAINAAAELGGRYPRFELESIPRLKPDLVLLPSEPYAFSTDDLPAIHTVYRGPVQFVDGELLTWYGPRIPQALQTFRVLFDGLRIDDE